MRIVIDGRMINESGIGRYLRNLIENLQILDNDNEYYILHLFVDYDRLVYYNKKFHKVLADFKWYTLTEQIRLPRILNKLSADLVHFPHFNVPILFRGKFVVTIHDLIHQHFQMRRSTTHDQLMYKIKQFGYEKIFRSAVKKSEKILVPSNFVKNLLVNEWSINESKIEVIYEGVDKNFTIGGNLSNRKIQKILDKFNIKQPFLFYVGNAHPHKNIEGLIKTFLELKRHSELVSESNIEIPGQARNDENGLQLVLSGQDNYFWQKIKNQYQYKDIVYTGFVTEEELAALYKSAKVFVMPSFEEGFGIPILEAMAVGCPVVSSNAGSLPEVGGDSAIYFDPHDIDDMVEKIQSILSYEKLREELIDKGRERVKDFSWKKLAQQTLEVYKQCV